MDRLDCDETDTASHFLNPEIFWAVLKAMGAMPGIEAVQHFGCGG